MDGVLNISKPAGITSHDVVSKARRILKIKRIGHAGTLDPMATGVLLLCVGKATRIVEYLMDSEKEYEGVMSLGVTTDSEDSTGVVMSETDASAVTEEHVREILPRFIGQIQQAPPMVSAVHHEGKRLYELARQGKVVDREARTVEVKKIEMLAFEPGARPGAAFRVTCSKGVYIRTLFADIGDALGVGAHMTKLTRTRVGRFSLSSAVSLDTLAEFVEKGKMDEVFIPMAEALSGMQQVSISPEMLEDVAHGKSLPVPKDLQQQDSPVLLTASGSLVALARVVSRDGETVLQPSKVFV